MRNPGMERVSLANKRHDFNSLSTDTAIDVRPAQSSGNSRYCRHGDADGSRGFRSGNRRCAGISTSIRSASWSSPSAENCSVAWPFSISTAAATTRSISGEFQPSRPDFGFFAGCDEPVSASYIWAIGATGRGIAGLGKAAAHLRKPRYVNADCFAQPSTAAGRDLMIATGFIQIPSFQPDLWCYQRPWKRLQKPMPSSNPSARSFEDARY